METTTEIVSEERVGAEFRAVDLARVQVKTWALLYQVREQIKPGMSEAEAHELYLKLQTQSGAEKYWHPPKIRFGKNTLCSFRELSDESVRLKDTDIFFLDLGPLYDGYEGDCGQTFVVGDSTTPLGQAATKVISRGEEIFSLVKAEWQKGDRTGADLYEYAESLAKESGYELIGEGANGHRVSEFPHAVHYRGSLRGLTRVPAPNRWILEIQLRDRVNNIGSFFEELI